MARIATIDVFGKDSLGLRDTERADRSWLQTCLDGAETFAERYCKRTFSPNPPFDDAGADTGTPLVKNFVAKGRTRIPVPDLRVVEAITLDDGIGAMPLIEGNVSGGYWLNTLEQDSDAAQEIQLMTMPTVRGQLLITGRWGPTVSPADVVGAILALAAKAYRRRDAMWSDQLATAEGLALFFTKDMPAEVAGVLDSYRVRRIAFA